MSKKRLSLARVMSVLLAFILALGAFAAMPGKAEAASKNSRRQVKSYTCYGYDRKQGAWYKEGFGSNVFSFTYDKYDHLKTAKVDYYSYDYNAKTSYKLRNNKKIRSSVTTVTYKDKTWDPEKHFNKYNRKGLRIKTTIGSGTGKTIYTYQYKKGYVSKMTHKSGGDILSNTRYAVTARKNGLLKSVTETNMYGEKTKLSFNGKGLVIRAALTYTDDDGSIVKTTTTYKYRYNKNGTVRRVVAYENGKIARKIEYKYTKKATSKVKYAAIHNYSLLGGADTTIDPWLMPLQ